MLACVCVCPCVRVCVCVCVFPEGLAMLMVVGWEDIFSSSLFLSMVACTCRCVWVSVSYCGGPVYADGCRLGGDLLFLAFLIDGGVHMQLSVCVCVSTSHTRY